MVWHVRASREPEARWSNARLQTALSWGNKRVAGFDRAAALRTVPNFRQPEEATSRVRCREGECGTLFQSRSGDLVFNIVFILNVWLRNRGVGGEKQAKKGVLVMCGRLGCSSGRCKGNLRPCGRSREAVRGGFGVVAGKPGQKRPASSLEPEHNKYLQPGSPFALGISHTHVRALRHHTARAHGVWSNWRSPP
jgi:hypothetical protein